VQSEYVEKVPSEELVYGALKGMLNELDPHSQFMPPDTYRELRVETEGHFGGLGIVIQLDENKVLTVVSPIEGTPAWKAGILAGDRIVQIEGETTHGLVLEEAVKKLRGPKGSNVTITILRLHEDDEEKGPEELEFTLTRDEINIPSVKVKVLEHDIGYVRLVEFSERTGADLEKKLKELNEEGVRSIVLDLRSNPGGLLNVAAEVSDKFLEKDRLIVYTESRGSEQDMKFKSRRNPTIAADVPMVVLVNGGSASASEIVAGALMDWRRAVILGEKTFGKGSVQSIIPLSDGSALRLTTAKYLTPNGHSINGVGIAPDIQVKMSMKKVAHFLSRREIQIEGEGEEAEVDDQLQRAIDLLRGYDIFKSVEQNINIAKKQEPESEEAAEDEAPEPTETVEHDGAPANATEPEEKTEPEQTPVEENEE
jgi:carboxyl-terminal processing protease